MRYVILGVRAHFYGDNPVKKQDFVSGEWIFGSLEFVRSNDLKALLTKRYGNEPFKFAIHWRVWTIFLPKFVLGLC